jgi:hypothetical protein
MLCAHLSLALLVGLGGNAAFGLWWLDPVTALAIAVVALSEGARELARSELLKRALPSSPPRLVLALSGAQVSDHGEHPAVGVLALGEVELHQNAADVALDGSFGEHEAACDRAVGQALGH